MLLQFGAQVEWRFFEYTQFPAKFMVYVHPGASEASKERTLDKFWGSNACCRNAFSEDVFQFFGAKDAMKANVDFESGLRTWGSFHKFTDMSMERLLSAFRSAVPISMLKLSV